MSKHNKIIALNGGEDTYLAFKKAKNIDIVTPKSREMSIEVDGPNVVIYLNSSPFDVDKSVIFNRYPTDAHFCGILLEYANTQNTTLLNPASLSYRRSSEKTAQMSRMAQAGIPVPHSFVVHIKTYEAIMPTVEEKLSYPIVCKVDGIRGEKVMLANNRDDITRFLRQYDESELCIFQKYIENNGDVRIICALGEYIGAIKRISAPNEFLNNVAQGARVEKYEPTAEEIKISLRACAINQFDLAGIDIMHTPNGPCVIEVNMGPGLEGYESIHGKHTTLPKLVNILQKNNYRKL